MSSFHPIKGQPVSSAKVTRSRELRQQMTPAERILWKELRALRPTGYAFRRQQIISGFIVDFYCHRALLVVEVDGGVHGGQQEYDADRDAVLAAHGVRILRVHNADVYHDLVGVMRRITATLHAAPHLSPR